jgi:ubiquitin carboxyl-terminal hydrolase 4/11/15
MMVNFPLTGLDLSKHHLAASSGTSDSSSNSSNSVYDCISVVNHYGSLGGGHYTAYALRDGEWLEFDDSRVSRTTPAEVVSKAAYILVYRRRKAPAS